MINKISQIALLGALISFVGFADAGEAKKPITIDISKKKLSNGQSKTRLRDHDKIGEALGMTKNLQHERDPTRIDDLDFNPKEDSRLKSASYSGDLVNSQDYAYVGKIYVGSAKQEFQVIFDTGSDYTAIYDSSCTNCVGTEFDTSTSSTFVLHTSTKSYLYYGSGSLYGYLGNDTVSLDSSQSIAATAFKMFLVTSQTGFSYDDFEGLVGMCREYSGSSIVSGPLFYNYLYDQSAISSKVFAFYISTMIDQSTLEIGGYNPSNMLDSSEADLVYVPLEDSIYWYANVTAFRVGDSDTLSDNTTSAYDTGDYPAIVDTGTSYLYIPYSFYYELRALLLTNITWTWSSSGEKIGPCDRSIYRSLFLYINGTYFEIDPYTYVIDDNSGSAGYCTIAISTTYYDYWLLGDVFLRNYYSIWDHDNDQLGLTPHKTSNATIEKSATLPTTEFVSYYYYYYYYDSYYYYSDTSIQQLWASGKMFVGTVAMTAALGVVIAVVFCGFSPVKVAIAKKPKKAVVLNQSMVEQMISSNRISKDRIVVMRI